MAIGFGRHAHGGPRRRHRKDREFAANAGRVYESGAGEILICRDGRPFAKLVVAEKARIGVARGKFGMPGDGAGGDCFDIATLFRGE